MLQFGFNEEEPVPEDAPVSFRVYRNRPVTVFASPIDEDFQVSTLEGIMQGRKGDYLVMGVEGEFYPVKASVFSKTYEYADEEEVSGLFKDKTTVVFRPAIPTKLRDIEKSNALDKPEDPQ